MLRFIHAVGLVKLAVLVPVHACTCLSPNAQIDNTGMGQRITSTGTSSGTGCPILENSLVPTCLTLLTSF
jgi:hypothetical protein